MSEDTTTETTKSEADQKADAEALANDQSNVVDTTNGQGDPTQNTNADANASADTQASPADNTNEASPQATPQGEVSVDQGARAHVLGEDTPSDPLDAKNDAISQAKADAVENHNREHNATHDDGRAATSPADTAGQPE